MCIRDRVCTARKKDIEWNVMYRVAKENATKRFKILEKAFLDKKLPEGCYGRITENGITGFWDFQYKKDETLQQFLARNRIIRKYKYPNFACAYLIDCLLYTSCIIYTYTYQNLRFEGAICYEKI